MNALPVAEPLLLATEVYRAVWRALVMLPRHRRDGVTTLTEIAR